MLGSNQKLKFIRTSIVSLSVSFSAKQLIDIFCVVFILRAISPCTTGLRVLFDPSDCTSTAQLSGY